MGSVTRRPLAREDLIEIWSHIAEDDDQAADRVIDRIEGVMRMLSDRPLAGRPRPELSDALRSFPVGSYVLFYLPLPGGIDLVRVRSNYLDIDLGDFTG